MNKISDITRQDIIDLFTLGYTNPETDESEKYFWSGKLEEPDFLARLYNLKTMPSSDRRYQNAYDDIYQHRVNNFDWDENWVFYDGRFGIKTASDEEWLKFLCESFHPAVRDERKNWRVILEQINSLLKVDGFELYESSSISGRPKYSWRKTTSRNVVVESQSQALVSKFNTDYIHSQIKIMNDSINAFPYEAIGKAKELFENCCKTILKEQKIYIDPNWDVIRLNKETCKILKLTPDDIDNSAKASETIKKLLGNLSVISQSMAELRNSYGSGHGKDAKFKGLTPRHARLAGGATVAAVLFLWETYEDSIK